MMILYSPHAAVEVFLIGYSLAIKALYPSYSFKCVVRSVVKDGFKARTLRFKSSPSNRKEKLKSGN